MGERFLRTDKIFHHPDRLDAYLHGELVRPVTVEIHLTNRCNLDCTYCMYKDRRNQQSLRTPQAKLAIRRLKEMGVRGLTFSGGGEPTVHSDFGEIVRFAKEDIGLDVALITNGVKFWPETLQYLTWIRFSVDTLYDDVYKKMKGVDKLQTVLANIKKAVEIKHEQRLDVTIGFQMVVTEDNYDHISQTAECASSLWVDYFQYRPLENDTYSQKALDGIAFQRTVMDTAIIPSHPNLKVIDTWYKWAELKHISYYTDCPGIDMFGAVDAYGNYYMCCHHVQDPTACYGSILNQEPDEILSARAKVQAQFDYRKKCPVACRGAVVNNRLRNFGNIEHRNFL